MEVKVGDLVYKTSYRISHCFIVTRVVGDRIKVVGYKRISTPHYMATEYVKLVKEIF